MNGHRRWQSRHRTPTLHRLATGVAVLCIVTGAVFVATVAYVNVGGDDQPEVEASGQAGGRAAGPAGSSASAGLGVPRKPVRTTPEGMLQLLSELLPDGETHAYAVHRGRDLEAELDFYRGRGQGQIRVVLGPNLTPAQRARRACTQAQARQECGLLPDGSIIHLWLGVSCLQNTISQVERVDGTQVRVEVGNCTVDTSPSSGGPKPGAGPPDVLSVGEAQLIAADDRWSRTMDPDLVDRGRREFADADQIEDPDRPVRTRQQ